MYRLLKVIRISTILFVWTKYLITVKILYLLKLVWRKQNFVLLHLFLNSFNMLWFGLRKLMRNNIRDQSLNSYRLYALFWYVDKRLMLFERRPRFLSWLRIWWNWCRFDLFWNFRVSVLLKLLSSIHFMDSPLSRFTSFSNSKFLRFYWLSFFSCCLPVIYILKIRRSHWVSVLIQIYLLLLPCTLLQNFRINQPSLF